MAFKDMRLFQKEDGTGTGVAGEADGAGGSGGSGGDDKPWYDGITDEAHREVAKNFDTSEAMAVAFGIEAKPAKGNWREHIKDDNLRKNMEKFTDPAALAVSYGELESRLGASIVLPGDEATEEEIAAYRKKMGIPAEVSGYEINRPEDLPENFLPDEAGVEREKKFLEVFHKLGYTQQQVDGAFDAFYTIIPEGMAAYQAANEKAVATAISELDAEWGDDKTANDEFGRRAVTQFGGEEFAVWLENTKVDGVPLGEHAMFRKAFARVGRLMAEGNAPFALPEVEQKTITERIDELSALLLTDPTKYATDGVQRQLRELNAKLYGDTPVVGEGGRVI